MVASAQEREKEKSKMRREEKVREYPERDILKKEGYNDRSKQTSDRDRDKDRERKGGKSTEIREKEERSRCRRRDRDRRSFRSPLEMREKERDRSSELRVKQSISGSWCTRWSPGKDNASYRTRKEKDCKQENEYVRGSKQQERRRDYDRNQTDEGRGRDERRNHRSRERQHSSAGSRLDVREREREKSRERQVERHRTDSCSRKRTPNRERFPGRAAKETEKEKREEREYYAKRKEQWELRGKEKDCKEHIRILEEREQRKLREREKESARMEAEKRVVDEKAKRLKTFLEDYEDGRDDPKFYIGSAFIKKIEARKREIEEDNRDRQREKEELQRTLAESGNSAPKPDIQSTLQEETHNSNARVSEQLDSSQGEEKGAATMQPPPSDVTSTTKVPSPREIRGKEELNPAVQVASPVLGESCIRGIQALQLQPEDGTDILLRHPSVSEMNPISKTTSPSLSQDAVNPPQEEVLEDEKSKEGFYDLMDPEKKLETMGFKSFKFDDNLKSTRNVSAAQTAKNSRNVCQRKMSVNEVLYGDEESDHKNKGKLMCVDDSREKTNRGPVASKTFSSNDDEELDRIKKRKHISSDDASEHRICTSGLHEVFRADVDLKEVSSQKHGTEVPPTWEIEADVEILKQRTAADVFVTHSSEDVSVSDTKRNTKVVLKRKMSTYNVHDVDDSEDEKLRRKKKRKLEQLADTKQERKPAAAPVSHMTTKERIKRLKGLINEIQIVKDDIFIYNLDWTLVDNTLIENKIQPWINKKIVEYAGQEVPILVQYLCLKVRECSDPQSILVDLTNILGDEAEFFVVSLWRLLIYETEAKKVG